MVACCHLDPGTIFTWQGRVYRFLKVKLRMTKDHNGAEMPAVDNCEVECIGNIGENKVMQVLTAQWGYFNPYCEVQPVVLLVENVA